MGPTGVVLELSHEDWEKMQNGATLEELKSVKEFGIDGYAERQRMNTGDNEKRDKIQRAKERLAKAQREDNVKEMGYGMKPMKKMKPMK